MIRYFLFKSVYDAKFFISSFWRSFIVMKNGVYFIVIAFLFAELFRIFGYAMWRHIVDTKWCKITKYGISVQILSLQGWNFAGLQQEQTTFLEGEHSDFIFWMERAWNPLCCHGNVTVEISRNLVLIATTVQSFRDIIFIFCDFTS